MADITLFKVKDEALLIAALASARDAISNHMGEWSAVVPEMQDLPGFYELAIALQEIDSVLDKVAT